MPAALHIPLPAALIHRRSPYVASGRAQSGFFTAFAWILASGEGSRYARPIAPVRGGIVSSPQPTRTLSREHIVEQLQAHGLKPTEQRIRIAELLMSVPTHMTAEQILAAVRRGGERVSKATVYNTLKVLAQRGLVRQIHLDPERSVYDSTRTPHHHFHDVETGELRDIDPDDIAFSRFPALPEGMEAEVEVVIRLRKKRAVPA
jgi:Fur family transcriptional regulator, iron response regulator